MSAELDLVPGAVAWAQLSPVRGREQSGHRPVVVVSGSGYLEAITTLAWCVPVTTVDRGWPNHVLLGGRTGLDRSSWGMTEQLRTLSRDRLSHVAGTVDDETFRAIRTWLADFLDLSTH